MVEIVKYENLNNKSVTELYQLYADLKKEQLNLRIQQKSNQLTNSSRCRECRRDIARIKTKLKQVKVA